MQYPTVCELNWFLIGNVILRLIDRLLLLNILDQSFCNIYDKIAEPIHTRATINFLSTA